MSKVILVYRATSAFRADPATLAYLARWVPAAKPDCRAYQARLDSKANGAKTVSPVWSDREAMPERPVVQVNRVDRAKRAFWEYRAETGVREDRGCAVRRVTSDRAEGPVKVSKVRKEQPDSRAFRDVTD